MTNLEHARREHELPGKNATSEPTMMRCPAGLIRRMGSLTGHGLQTSILLVLACAAPTPHPMPESGISENAEAAKRHEQEAIAHRSRAEFFASSCPTGAPCWSALANPGVAQEYEQAEKQERFAADHRARVKELHDAELQSCRDVSEYDQTVSPFAHLRDIRSVAPITGDAGRLQGMVVSFKEVRGLTVESVQRIVRCHLARNAALGHDVPEMVNCPLVSRVHATVFGDEGAVAVRITADDDAAARELSRCAAFIGAAVGPQL